MYTHTFPAYQMVPGTPASNIFACSYSKTVILKMYLKIAAEREKNKKKITPSHEVIGNNFIQSLTIS